MDCPRCTGLKVIDPLYIIEAKKTCAELSAQLLIFAKEQRIDYRDIPAFTEVARMIRVLEML